MNFKLIITAMIIFSAIISFLLLLISYIKKKLISNSDIEININSQENDNLITAKYGQKLYEALVDNKIYPSSACGGGGTCGQCKIKVLKGGGSPLLSEKAGLSKKDIKKNYRLSCQMPVKNNLDIEIPYEILSVKEYKCKVISNKNVSRYIKETILEINNDFNFQSGQYIQIITPPYKIDFATLNIEEPFKQDWDLTQYKKLFSKNQETVTKAYSMANYPKEKNLIKLNVRLALPPQNKKYPPGVVSSYIFNLKEGDEVYITGPYGDFIAQNNNKEKIFLGGGAGMAPLRSIIFEQLYLKENKNKISFWYGARSVKDLFYEKEFELLSKEFSNFSFHKALSEPDERDNWQGNIGFIHDVFEKNYLINHEEPEECEYYICGPTLMTNAVLKLLENYGVENENIFFDDFG